MGTGPKKGKQLHVTDAAEPRFEAQCFDCESLLAVLFLFDVMGSCDPGSLPVTLSISGCKMQRVNDADCMCNSHVSHIVTAWALCRLSLDLITVAALMANALWLQFEDEIL